MIVVIALIFDDQTAVAQDVHPALAFCVLWIAILWLSVVEGGQGALVGLAPVHKSLYQTSHPLAYQCTTLAHSGDHLNRYLIGRQFLVVLLVFVVNQCGAPVDSSATLWNWPVAAQEILVRSSLAIILVTAMVGQLHTQINASNCMLDYINNRLMLFTLRVSLALEASGAMHAVYLLQWAFAKLANQQEPPMASSSLSSSSRGGGGDNTNQHPNSNDEEQGENGPQEVQGVSNNDEEHGPSSGSRQRTGWQAVLFWTRVAFPIALLAFSFAVTLTALFNEQTNMWSGIPVAISVILFFGFMFVLGILEGTQIAVFAVSRIPIEELKTKYPKNVWRCIEILLLYNDGQNIPRFMIGRQILVTLLTFITARVSTVNVDTEDESDNDNIWGVPNGLQDFFNTGLLGAIIVTLVGSISWKLVGSSFPVIFLSNPLVYLLIRLCLGLEASGICSGAWVLATIHRKCSGFQLDEYYVGTPEDRLASNHPDNTNHPSLRDSISLHQPMHLCGSSRYLQVDDMSRASSRYFQGLNMDDEVSDKISRSSFNQWSGKSSINRSSIRSALHADKNNNNNEEEEGNKGSSGSLPPQPSADTISPTQSMHSQNSLSHHLIQGMDNVGLEIELDEEHCELGFTNPTEKDGLTNSNNDNNTDDNDNHNNDDGDDDDSDNELLHIAGNASPHRQKDGRPGFLRS